MNTTQIALVRDSHALVQPIADAAAALFYDNLFEADPSLRRLFRGDMDQQGKALMQMIGSAIGLLERPASLVPVLRSLGARHAGYGVQATHYDTVGSALLKTLEQGLGPAFTPDVKAAWATMYGIVATEMQAGARAVAAAETVVAPVAAPVAEPVAELAMTAPAPVPHAPTDTQRYARCIEASKRIRWDIDRDVIRGRTFQLDRKFLPDGLSMVDELPFLDPAQQRFFGQVQGRTYANMFGLVERFIGAKMLEISRDHWLGDQTALEALVRFTDEELKHQELFRRIEKLAAATMPAGYRFDVEPNDVAAFVLGKSTWSVLALTCHIELFTQAHYRASIEGAQGLSDLYKDVFLFHWKEESQHAILDELEWRREDAKIGFVARDAAVDDLIALVVGVDGILQAQAKADAAYFSAFAGIVDAARAVRVHDTMLKAYRWQYIVSGVVEPRFRKALGAMASDAQMARIEQALAPLTYAMPRETAEA